MKTISNLSTANVLYVNAPSSLVLPATAYAYAYAYALYTIIGKFYSFEYISTGSTQTRWKNKEELATFQTTIVFLC